MFVKKYGIALFAIICLVASAVSLGQATTPDTGETTGTKTLAKTVPGAEKRKPSDTGTWSTEGSGYCDTGNLTCNSSGRQIGCNATGDYVYCSYTYGDVGSVYCYASSDDGTTSSFSDECP